MGCQFDDATWRNLMEQQVARRPEEAARYTIMVGFQFSEWADVGSAYYRDGIRAVLQVEAEDTRLSGHGISIRTPGSSWNATEGRQKALSRALRDLTAGVSGPRLTRIERAVWAAWQASGGGGGEFKVQLNEGNVSVSPAV